MKKLSRPQTLGEEIGNAVTHGIAAAGGLVFMILMLIKSTNLNQVFGALLFGIGMIMLYLMSCLYHSFKNDTTVKRVFKRFDHLSIYLLIGGTFAPILLNAVSQPIGYIFFGIQWAFIIFGVVLKAINPNKHHKLHLIFYLVVGWSGLLLIPQLWVASQPLFWLILAGGATYSLGVAFYVNNFKWGHFIWHFFCMAATILHFIGIYCFIY